MNSMRLPVALIKRQDNFINLPRVAARGLFGTAIPSGAVAFKLTWHSRRDPKPNPALPATSEDDIEEAHETQGEQDTINVAYVAWRGGYSSQPKLELPQSLAECLGLSTVLSSNPGANTFVQISKTTCSRVTKVNLDPVHEDDWEMLGLHARRLEDSMLEQVCILYAGQMFSVAVGKSSVIHLKVGQVEFMDGAPCGILGRNSELIIAPRERKKHKTEHNHGEAKSPSATAAATATTTATAAGPTTSTSTSTSHTLPRLQLRIQPMCTNSTSDMPCNALSTVWVHPRTLDWSEFHRKGNNSATLYAYMSSHCNVGPPASLSSNENENGDGTTSVSANSVGRPREAMLVKVQSSTFAAVGHVVLSRNHLLNLQAAPLLSDIWLYPCHAAPPVAVSENELERIVLYPRRKRPRRRTGGTNGVEKEGIVEEEMLVHEKELERAFWKVTRQAECQDSPEGLLLGHRMSLIELTVPQRRQPRTNRSNGDDAWTMSTNVYEVRLLTSAHNTNKKATILGDAVAENVWNEYESKMDGRAARQAAETRKEAALKASTVTEAEEEKNREATKPWWVVLQNNDGKDDNGHDDAEYMLVTPTKKTSTKTKTTYRPPVSLGTELLDYLPFMPPKTRKELQHRKADQQSLSMPGLLNVPPHAPRSHVGGVAALIAEMWSLLAPRLVAPAVELRHSSLRSPAPVPTAAPFALPQCSVPPAGGHVYLTGGRGQGKTTIAGVVSNMLNKYTLSLSHVVWVDCRSLLGQTSNNIERTLTHAWREAANRSPSILIFDDLDVLIPSDNQGGGENATAARFAELMVDLAWECNSNADKRLAWCRNAAGSGGGGSGHRAVNEVVLDRWAAANSHGIGVIATGERIGSLHVELRRSTLFDQHVEVPKYDQQCRVDILQALIAKRADEMSEMSDRKKVNESETFMGTVLVDEEKVNALLRARDDLDFYTLAQKMEGYGPSDMDMVLERVCNRSANRTMEEMQTMQQEQELNVLRDRARVLEEELMTMGGGTKTPTAATTTLTAVATKIETISLPVSSSSMELTQSDFDIAMEGFIPASLRGIKFTKSNIEWGDVGGLVDVSGRFC